MMPMRALAAAPLFSLSIMGCATARPAQPAARPGVILSTSAVVLRGATVWTASGTAIADGAVAFEGPTLVYVGPSAGLPISTAAASIDARGKFVTPGIIDDHSHLGVYPSPGLSSTSDGNEMTDPVTAEISAEHSFWPQDPGLRRAAAGGVTALLVLPGSANLIGGRGFPVKLRFGRTAAAMRFPGAKDSLKMACGENPKRVYGGNKRAPSTRMGNVAGYRQAFAKAQEYAAKLQEYEKKRKASPGTAGPAPQRDLKLETLAGVLRGEILVQNHCYRADEMQVMLDVAGEFGFRIRAFHHALEAYKLRDVLASTGTAIATWADWWGFKLEAFDGIPENAGLTAEAGGRVTIHSDSELGIQRLNQEAGKAMWRARQSGITVSDEEALRWITLNPAWVMGVDERTGSLESGKLADLVVWDRQPFSVYARAERVYADGRLTFDSAAGAADPGDFELSIGQAAPPARSELRIPAAISSLSPSGAAPLPLPSSEPACTWIRDAVVAAEGGVRPRASVLVRGGQVVSVADQADPGSDCRQVSAEGAVLTPGFIDPASGLGLVEISMEVNDSSSGGLDKVDVVHAAMRAADSLNAASVVLPVARLGGVTSSVSAPEGGLISGQSAHLAMDGAVLSPSVAMHAVLGERGAGQTQSNRGGAIELLREVLDDAREYQQRRADFEQNRMRPVAASRLDLEALRPVLAGRQPLVVRVDRASDIRAALALRKDYGLRLILAGAAEAWKVADELANAKVPVIAAPLENLPESFDKLAARLDAPALLAARGVKVLFATMDRAHMARALPQHAGNAVAWGMDWEEAMRAVSANVADAFGLPGGRIAPGARADLVLWSGDPLELSSRPLAMWIGGSQVELTSRQARLLEKYRKLP